MQDLGTLGGNWSEARNISLDGTIIIGRARNSANRWRAAGAVQLRQGMLS
jgi:uncharacterized membrane protein